jgi:hypothetical protein
MMMIPNWSLWLAYMLLMMSVGCVLAIIVNGMTAVPVR